MSNTNFYIDKPHDECGVLAIYAPHEEVASMTYFGLYALQHRGQEAAGIAIANGQQINMHKGLGLVSQVFNPQNLSQLSGHLAIGHTRYSTTGSSSLRNAQPFLIDTQYGELALAHNGNLTNAQYLRSELLKHGIGLSMTSDSGVMAMMLAGSQGDNWEERLQNTMPKWAGAYSLVILTNDKILAARDPWGFRPLSLGQLENGGYAIASETSALQTLGCHSISEIMPGEIVAIDAKGMKRFIGQSPAKQLARCTFEHIYFSRPDSVWDNLSIHHVRQRLGETLWNEMQLVADMVMPVPDSAVPAAIGYSRASQVPYNDGLVKNRYIGRTFIQPTDSLRKKGVALKFNALNENLYGKRVLMIDDSIVRGNTSGPLVKLLRQAGAKEVHVAITCPPITHPCYMGVDMGTTDELIAHQKTVEEIRQHIQCDSLYFISLDGMMQALNRTEGYCNACFTGKYPIDINSQQTKTGFEK